MRKWDCSFGSLRERTSYTRRHCASLQFLHNLQVLALPRCCAENLRKRLHSGCRLHKVSVCTMTRELLAPKFPRPTAVFRQAIREVRSCQRNRTAERALTLILDGSAYVSAGGEGDMRDIVQHHGRRLPSCCCGEQSEQCRGSPCCRRARYFCNFKYLFEGTLQSQGCRIPFL